MTPKHSSINNLIITTLLSEVDNRTGRSKILMVPNVKKPQNTEYGHMPGLMVSAFFALNIQYQDHGRWT